jgi:fructan beta-fructosidase
MRSVALAAGLLSIVTACSSSPSNQPSSSRATAEEFRPQFHFTPERHWMNDPNGLVYFDGEYHLFFQHNPFGNKWGHMSWGHAVSRDLVGWEQLPVAIPEQDGVMIFSGSAVVDWNNTSGFGSQGRPPLVALYTGHYPDRGLQNQQLAYSTDRGRTWTKYERNPVLDIGARDFRDPKVFWHPPTGRWVMVVAMPTERKLRFYTSPDLKQWEQAGEFGPAGAVEGIWECPDLFPLLLDDGSTRWVLIVSLGSHAVAGGSGMQYFTGTFDGRSFAADDQDTPAWVDFGRDFYAAVSWSDIPAADGRRLWIGWMSNWDYAQDVPTSPWRSAMSIPRSLSLARVDGRLRLIQTPATELLSLRGRHQQVMATASAGRALFPPGESVAASPLQSLTDGPFELEAIFEPSEDAVVAIAVRKGPAVETLITADIADGQLTIDRSRSGRVGFSDDFPGTARAPIRLVDGRLAVRLFVDRSSIETFINSGETVLTTIVFPPDEANGLEMTVTRGSATARIDLWSLDAAPTARLRPSTAPAP